MWGVQEYCATLPLVFTPAGMCMSTVCCKFLTFSSYHLSDPLPLAPLMDSLVTCQGLTSLELTWVTLSLQSVLAVVRGLHTLKALGVKGVSLSDDRVSDCV